MKNSWIFLLLTLAFTTTVFCQDTILKPATNDKAIATLLNADDRTFKEWIKKRIKLDSATYSWEQVNEFVNGLENEMKLSRNYKTATQAIIECENSYIISERQNTTYKDTIIPVLEGAIKTLNDDFVSVADHNEVLEDNLKAQKSKKWLWAGASGLIFLIFGLVLGM